MNTFKLLLSNPSSLAAINRPIIPIRAKSPSLARFNTNTTKTNHSDKSLLISKESLTGDVQQPHVVSSDKHSKMVVLGAMSFGLALLLMGFDGHKAMALGPRGPLMEEFWDNMRRYALYALTVSTGAIYTLLQPIVELLKNPISAVLILVIIGGAIFIVSQVVTAMVGLSDFSYDYSY
ncbi:proteasome subunit alpha [Striga asiatica]|uniref:Uncharacterized protein ycf33 n=1 Tax=Striga asiatica TaxID=4170 RepID=A0A5A7R596_STRAF|nr:proteasome subunit alpha [Striga asiatica]